MQLRPNRDRSKKGIEYNEDLKRKQKKKSKPIEIKESSSDLSSEYDSCDNDYEADMLDDAKKYEKALQNTLQFVTCGVCGYEGSVTKFLNRKDSYRPMKFPGKNVQDIIDGSKLSDLYNAITASFENTKYPPAQYISEWDRRFDSDGTITGTRFICKGCVRVCSNRESISSNKYDEYEEDNIDEVDNDFDNDVDEIIPQILGNGKTNVSKYPMFNSKPYISVPLNVYMLLFTGECPLELKCLNTVELSMVSPINAICRILINGKHEVLKAKVVCIVNEVAEIAKNLPTLPTPESFATISSECSSNPAKKYYYRPFYVRKALKWLIDNNVLFNKHGIKNESESLLYGDATKIIPVDSHLMSKSDCDALDEAFQEGLSTNTGNEFCVQSFTNVCY
jgi:hypothetical protein